MAKELSLPPLGENIQSATVAAVTVEIGQTINVGDTILEIETDKAVVDVPSPVSGKVVQLRVQQGDTIEIGAPVLEFEEVATDSETASSTADASEPTDSLESAKSVSDGEVPTQAPDADSSTETKTTPPEAADPAPAAAAEARPSGEADSKADSKAEAAFTPVAAATPVNPARHVPAAPSVRRFARECGVEVDTVKGSGSHGRVSVDDVKRHLRERLRGTQGAALTALPPLPDFSRWGTVRQEPMRAIRKATARQVSASWQSVPRVTHFDEADITGIEVLRRRYADRAAAQGGKLTMAVMVVKVVAAALRKFPQFNASIDMGNETIIYKDYVHIGIAVATQRGLMVPVLRNADRKNMIELAVEIDAVAKTCREGKIKPEDLQGGTFTVTNLGAIGGSFFTPIVNVPEVAILGMGRAMERPLVREGKLETATLLPLSLSYDHRLIDGADAARFTRWIAEAVAEPLVLSLEAPA